MDMMKTLQNIQAEHGYLPMDELKKLDSPLAATVGTASFYEFFRFEPSDEESHIQDLYPIRKSGPILSGEHFGAAAAAAADPDAALNVLKTVALRGRGGAAFPVATKWELTRKTAAGEKFVICNADEGEPGTGKDRAILVANPGAVVDGMAACAAIVGAAHGIIYLRAEYADLKDGIEAAIANAGLANFSIRVHLGMGAYVCGEETALLESLEGRRGEPRLKPPYPGVAGYLGKPTVINNVESFAYAACVIGRGAHAFACAGSESCCGYKVYTISGCVNAPGVYECEAGITVKALTELAGGVKDGKKIAAIQVGGGSGRLLKTDAIDMPLDPDGCRAYGTSLGTGAVYLIAEDECIKEHVRK